MYRRRSQSMSTTLGAVAAGLVFASAVLPSFADEGVTVNAQAAPPEVYMARVKTVLTRAMHFPTGREASLEQPAGAVSIWFVVRHDGSVAARGLERSSGSAVLDGRAGRVVERTHYPAMPDDAWGTADQRFVATFHFDRRADADRPVEATLE